MDSKWEKMNPVLFQKIKEYNREHVENHYEIVEFENEKKKLFQQIQQKTHKHKCLYTFPRKIHQNPTLSKKEDDILNGELSTKTYNLHDQNKHDQSHRERRLSSFHIGKPSSKNSFVVRKNNGLQLSRDKQKRTPSQKCQSTLNRNFSREVRNSCQNHKSVSRENHASIPIPINLSRVLTGSKQIHTPTTIKKRSILVRKDSSSSFNSTKENKFEKNASIDRLKTTAKSKFNQSKFLPRLLTQSQNQ